MSNLIITGLFASLFCLSLFAISKTKWKDNRNVFAGLMAFYLFVYTGFFNQSLVSNDSILPLDRLLHANDNIQPMISLYLPFFFSTIFGLVLTYFLLVIKSKL